MNRLFRVYKERLKFYILILLVTASLVQLGILWSYQNQGLPFNFLNLFGGKQTSVDYSESMRDFFSPYKVIISQGFDISKCILNKEHPDYAPLWKEAKGFIGSALKMKNVEPLELSQWYDLIERKVFILDFNTNIKIGILKDFLNLSEIMPGGPSGIYKMIISPWENETNYDSTITIYINDGIKIYKYDLFISPSELSKDLLEYDKIITDLSDPNNEFVSYSFLKSLLGDSLRGFSEDATVVSRPFDVSYNNLTRALPFGIGSNGEEDIVTVATNILGSQKDNYEGSIDPDRTIELKTLNNIYKVRTDGFMEYKYLPFQNSSDKGALEDAFKKAFEFVNNVAVFSDNVKVKLFLSGYKENENGNSYQFMFDYMVSDHGNDLPIFVNYSYKDDTGESKVLNNAVIVTANSKNVLNCKALINKLITGVETKQYDIGLPEATFFKSVKLLSDKNDIEKNISISYEMNNENNNSELNMVWAIKDGDSYYSSPIINK